MKTANEILTEIDVALCLSTFQTRKLELLRLFQEQQLDAKRAGMTEAAEICKSTIDGSGQAQADECAERILSARDNLKEI